MTAISFGQKNVDLYIILLDIQSIDETVLIEQLYHTEIFGDKYSSAIHSLFGGSQDLAKHGHALIRDLSRLQDMGAI